MRYKPNYYLDWHKRRKRLAAILTHLERGGTVLLCTAYRVTKITAKHSSMLRAVPDGLYIQRGKNWECLNFTTIRFA